MPHKLDPSTILTIPKTGDLLEPNEKDESHGVKVPGIGAEIPEQLFAEDADYLAERPTELQIAEEKLIE
ncbi:hypothetical protein AYI70_g6576 [Smittium culicis]|uniref:Uncharacterized protein n=1 Tax=Smittium culicis TaxID=133412 RepID=A0A1R1XPA2_9FUNG|nr:hypothetical protein AYI70_g6576 [Smittium culicis]